MCGRDSLTGDASRLLKLASGSRARLLGYTHVQLIHTRDNSQHRVLTLGGDSPTIHLMHYASRLLKLAGGSRVKLLAYTGTVLD